MDRLERIYQLYAILRTRRYGVSLQQLCEQLEHSPRTLSRDIQALRNLGAPLLYNRETNTYTLDTRASPAVYELPGLWFNASELQALLIGQSVLSRIQPGVLEDHIAPLKKRIEHLLQHKRAASPELARRVRILQSAARHTPLPQFHKITTALIQRKQLRILYHGRARDKTTERNISPQRLVYYRDNWYLDAWCHQGNGLRTFSLDRLQPIAQLDNNAIDIDDRQLDAQLTASYGIFDGPAQHIAVLHFSPHAAKWIADEHWHPQQQSQTLPNGGHELRIPYSNPTELIMDILKYGPDVEVIEPTALRNLIHEKLQASLKIYQQETQYARI